jgi:hypothetical protein
VVAISQVYLQGPHDLGNVCRGGRWSSVGYLLLDKTISAYSSELNAFMRVQRLHVSVAYHLQWEDVHDFMRISFVSLFILVN